jgi:tyrosine decarboxylase/aspartate 1-decarboxylase
LSGLQEKGIARKTVFRELRTRLGKDFTYNSGRILGSMCTSPHPFAKQIYGHFFEKNLGDPGLFPASAEIEREAVHMLGSLLSHPEAVGHVVSGGTEANILAMWTARNLHNHRCNEIVAPESVHLSFEKAADLLNLKLVKVRLDEDFRMDVEDASRKISEKTCALVGVAGTTGLGIVDPIAELSELALSHGIMLHVDAAFGGFVLPFLRELGFEVPDFDFRLPGVASMTIDAHKMGLAPIPAGGILFRDSSMMKAVSKRISYLAGGETEQATIVGTRPGASCLAVWALLRHMGRKGYRNIVKRCMKMTLKLASGVEQVEGLRLLTRPRMNVIGVKSEEASTELLAQTLRRRGWAVALFPSHIRIVVMPHVTSSHVDIFLEDLNDAVKKLRSKRDI